MSRDFQGGNSGRGKAAGRATGREQSAPGGKRLQRSSSEGPRRPGGSFTPGRENRPGNPDRNRQGGFSGGERRGSGFRPSSGGPRSFTPGSRSSAPGQRSFTRGAGSPESGPRSFTPGSRSSAPGQRSFTRGAGSSESGQRSFTPGSRSSAPGQRSFTRGAGSSESGQRSFTPGSRSSAPGQRSFTRGAGSPAGGSRFSSPGVTRRRTLGDERAAAGRASSSSRQEGNRESGKKLTLKGDRRPSRHEILRELGRSTERKETVRSTQKEELIRLNRFISNAGVCSRREADKYITAGVVTVNGQIVTELGTKVSPSDEVRFDNRLLTPERKVYVLLNKPKDVVTTTDDPHAERTVMELVKEACDERIYPVGRLDKNTTGLLLLTNDGELSKRLTHPSHKVEKVYQVTLDRTVSVADIQKMTDGIELEDGPIAADAVSFIEGEDKDTLGIEIHSGRNRIVRRIFESLGYRVRALDRVSFAGLTKKNLPRGKWRMLSPREVSFLKMK